jgi:dihydroorotase
MVEMSRISIRHGRLIDPANGLDRDIDLHLADGRVLAIGDAPDGFHPGRTLDARGLIVCPGSST